MSYLSVFEIKLLVLSRGARQAVGGIVEELQQCFHRYFVESFSNEVTKFVLEFRVSGGVGRFDGEGMLATRFRKSDKVFAGEFVMPVEIWRGRNGPAIRRWFADAVWEFLAVMADRFDRAGVTVNWSQFRECMNRALADFVK